MVAEFKEFAMSRRSNGTKLPEKIRTYQGYDSP